MTRFIDCSAFKYSRSLNFPIPGFTAFDQVKIPAIKPVDNITEAKLIFEFSYHFICYLHIAYPQLPYLE